MLKNVKAIFITKQIVIFAAFLKFNLKQFNYDHDFTPYYAIPQCLAKSYRGKFPIILNSFLS